MFVNLTQVSIKTICFVSGKVVVESDEMLISTGNILIIPIVT
jgi:hypothetical protein